VSNAERGKAVVLGHARRGRRNRNARDMPTSVSSNLARKNVEPPQLGKANDRRCPSLGASQSCCLMERSVKRPRANIAKSSDEVMLRPQDATILIEQQVGSDECGLRDT